MARKKNLRQKKELKLVFGYEHELTPKLINGFMRHGKKSVVENFVLPALEKAQNHFNVSERVLVEKICENIAMDQEISNRKHKGSSVAIPVPVSQDRAKRKAMKLIITCTRENCKEKGIGSEESLFQVLQNAFEKKGTIAKKVEEKQDLIRSRRMFSHLTRRPQQAKTSVSKNSSGEESIAEQ